MQHRNTWRPLRRFNRAAAVPVGVELPKRRPRRTPAPKQGLLAALADELAEVLQLAPPRSRRRRGRAVSAGPGMS